MRQVKIISLATSPDLNVVSSVGENQAMMLYWLDRAGALRPDFVCFSEISLHLGMTPKEKLLHAQTVPGPSTSIAAEYARKFNTHLVWALVERDGDRFYNTAVLISRTGDIIGRYRKFQPTSGEMANGICPGTEIPVFATDGGRVGFAICFDLKFPEVGLALSRGRANLVFWLTMFPGGGRMIAWARDYGFYLVSSYDDGCVVVDPTGQVIAEKSKSEPFFPEKNLYSSIYAEINTDQKTYHLDYNVKKIPDIEAKYGPGVGIHYCRPEATFVLSSNLPDRTVEDIEREFDLIDLRAYLDGAIADKSRFLGKL